MNGGELIADGLRSQGVESLFTLCGGHISPILVAARQRAIRVVDVRDEASAVFAADAHARLTGVPGVAAVTAGPGVTNTLTAIENARLAQSPVVLLGGATATILSGRGALQDIDQQAIAAPHVKWHGRARRVAELLPLLEHAFREAASGVPGPVFLETPVDLLYDEKTVREWYDRGGGGGGLAARLQQLYLERHLRRLFGGAERRAARPVPVEAPQPRRRRIERVREVLLRSHRPILLVGSQATLLAPRIEAVSVALHTLGVPVYLSGMARGLLGGEHPLQVRHGRRRALEEADLVLLAGVPCDFRLGYGRQIPPQTPLVSFNRSRRDLQLNRRPKIGVPADPALCLEALATGWDGSPIEWARWLERLRQADAERDEEIDRSARDEQGRAERGVHPVHLLRAIDEAIQQNAVLVVDGGDFAATAAYTLRPRGPLGWLDPGVFGTLGVGGGFALGAAVSRPGAPVWLIWGDGSAAFSLAEFDSFVRHRVPVIAVVGNDASWAQIARDQVALLGDDVGTALRHSDYHLAAEGYGGRGLLLTEPDRVRETIEEAVSIAAAGQPVLVNAHLAPSDFRQGSLSI